MNNDKDDTTKQGNLGSFLAGALMGSIAGAAAMLLLAPQSGQKTRAQIEATSVELRDDAAHAIESATKQARRTSQKVTADVREKAEELQQRGEQFYTEQRENLAAFVSPHNEVKAS